jgi:hypothetical protein
LLIKKKNFYEKIIFIKTTSVKYRKWTLNWLSNAK